MMTFFMEFLFWTSLSLIVYSYVGYPLIVWFLSRRRRQNNLNQSIEEKKTIDANSLPSVTVVIAAYREESVILERLNNLAKIDYPSDKFEVLIGCDGNLDLTGELVSTYDDDRIRLIQFEKRRGKASVLNDCVPEAKGEIIVFSDANTKMDPQCIKQLVKHFQDEDTGCVCGQLILEDAVAGNNVDGIYWKYENFLKQCETKLGAVLGVNGALYALRKELYTPIPPELINDDFLIGMRVHLAGQRVIYEKSAFATEETAPSVQAEFQRRVRIGTGGFQCLKHLKGLLHPKYGYIAFAFWSHKVLRWFCPVFMLIALLTNIYLFNYEFYQSTLILQELFYLSALIGIHFVIRGRHSKIFRIPGMFVQMNFALAIGLFRCLFIRQNGTWERTEREQSTPLPIEELNPKEAGLDPIETESSHTALIQTTKS
ncbi:glycosyltransferase family 2 protein [Gimesia aquarii]|uniref:Beta-monoglucosyldiacylglycerol synthase n=1 Tax=Gimesia aquarii TaxID=2527964 RepID=A0A517VWB8_9PLAN|nr:glycosyltransferase family 2 protein [Gimesia aquarii]QDT97294.1 Beta-monoglucosyldiacylglycerol synthase [Gimesia aquarii]